MLDEPTAVLTAQEVKELTGVLNRLKQDGTAIVFISHKLGEVLEVADRITVLRRGKKVDTVPAPGRHRGEPRAPGRRARRAAVGLEDPGKPEGPLLEVRDLYVRDDRELEKVSGLSLSVRAGEIVALAGVDGNGQQELVDAITGMRAPESGAVRSTVRTSPARACERRRMPASPTSPKTASSAASCSRSRLTENLALREYRSPLFSARGWLRLSHMKDLAKRLLQEFDVRGGGPGQLRGVALGRQPAEGLRRARDRVEPQAAGRPPADPWPRCRRDRVRAPPPDRGARQGSRGAARVARVRGGEGAGRPDPRDLRG